jgi:hypothetical protein
VVELQSSTGNAVDNGRVNGRAPVVRQGRCGRWRKDGGVTKLTAIALVCGSSTSGAWDIGHGDYDGDCGSCVSAVLGVVGRGDSAAGGDYSGGVSDAVG